MPEKNATPTVAEIVVKKLKSLGEERQVLCVTHLPQVASQAREQWCVAKGADSGSAKSRVAVLDQKSRIEEIARMLGGLNITDKSRAPRQERTKRFLQRLQGPFGR